MQVRFSRQPTPMTGGEKVIPIKTNGPLVATRSVLLDLERFDIILEEFGKMFYPIIFIFLLAKTTLASNVENNGGWQTVSGPSGYGSSHDLGGSGGNIQNSYGHQSGGLYSSYDSYGSSGGYGHSGFDGGLGGGYAHHHYAQAIPIGQHIEVTKPVVVPVYKDIGVPVAHPVAIAVPHPVAVAVAQPYPVHVPVAHPVAIPVVKTVAVPVEKKVPYPVEKIIPVPVEKHIPITIEKHIPVPVEKPYPIHIPVYKHVFHRTKSYGWSH